MRKSLLLCSTIALLAIAAISCTKKTESPVMPKLTGYYQGTYTETGSSSVTFYILIKDDNTTASIVINNNDFFGNIAIQNNSFTGKFYGAESKPIAFIENGTINGTGTDRVLEGTLKYNNQGGSFAVAFISEELPA